MFTGIVQGTASVRRISDEGGIRRLRMAFPEDSLRELQQGASIAIAGVCLTVVGQEGDTVDFDVIDETLRRTTLGRLSTGDRANFERAARFGDEIGGHSVSGHIFGQGEIVSRSEDSDNLALV
ncbi:MAG: riboflavin synthase, partial [Myxococcota bacterium]